MTNKHDEKEPSKDSNRNPRLAALLAVHLVSQVLDEAYVIANAAQDSGQPWRYISMLKNYKTNEIGFADDEDESFKTSKGDNNNENNVEMVANIVTSTPQKNAARPSLCSDETLTICNDSTLIGQGDEEIEIQQNDFTNSTSMFINQLFDMSDVERILLTEDPEIAPSSSEPNILLAEAINKIMDSCVASAFPPDILPTVIGSFIGNTFSSTEDLGMQQNVNDTVELTEMLSSDQSEYSFLADAFVPNIERDVAFFTEEEEPADNTEANEILKTATVEEITEVDKAITPFVSIERDIAFFTEEEGPAENTEVDKSLKTATVEETTEDVEEKEKEAMKQNYDFELYEKAYMTLNRDYDQCSEDDGYPILQDPKEIILQEVELLTANTSDEELRYPKASVSKKDEEATVSGLSGSRRSTLARKCRNQGARLFACLRGWWRRKTPGTRKESRRSGLPVCPLSPDARRRASSLLDNRLLRSPSPSCSVAWKFNTVNESSVKSNRWKDYTFDKMAERSGFL